MNIKESHYKIKAYGTEEDKEVFEGDYQGYKVILRNIVHTTKPLFRKAHEERYTKLFLYNQRGIYICWRELRTTKLIEVIKTSIYEEALQSYDDFFNKAFER
jgi:hypothetical protein